MIFVFLLAGMRVMSPFEARMGMLKPVGAVFPPLVCRFSISDSADGEEKNIGFRNSCANQSINQFILFSPRVAGKTVLSRHHGNMTTIIGFTPS
jgi:hypothetical protein